MNRQDKNIESIYLLSPMQQGMLFHTLLAPQSGAYFEQRVLTLAGNLNEAALQQAWQWMIDRHAVLRTFFVWKGQERPLQVVLRRVALPWNALDWRGLPSVEQHMKLEALLEKDRRCGFDLSAAPLVRLTLIRMEEDYYELLWSLHHLLMDGWSEYLVLRDLLAVYQALCQGRECQLSPVRPYKDFMSWLQRHDSAKAEQFWRGALKGFHAPTPLLDERVDSDCGDKTYEVGEDKVLWPSESLNALKSFGARHGLTLNTIIQGVWALLLSRYSGDEDVLFGSTVSGRPAELAGVESMVGTFINTLPVRAQGSGEESVLAWLQKFQTQLLELRQYEHSPLVEVQGWSEVPRGQPLFESLLVFENYRVDTSIWDQERNLQIANIRAIGPTNYPLLVLVVPRKELTIKIHYDVRRFPAPAISRLLGHFVTLLEGIAANPRACIGQLPLLSESERHQVLVEWNRTEVNYPKDHCLHQLIEDQVELAPEATALVSEGTSLTYRQLNDRANQLAHYLRSLGVQPEQLVGVCMERSPEMVVALYGILKAGGAYVPLDPAYPAERLAFMIDDARMPVLLTQGSLVEGLPDQATRLVRLDRDWSSIGAERGENPDTICAPENLAYVIYTSGSTGQPKGVAIEHRSAVAFIAWARTVFTDKELSGVLFSTSICFDLSIFELFVTLAAGGKVILAENALQLPVLKAADEVTLVNTVPSAMAELVRAHGLPRSVLTVNLAGEPLPASLVDQIYERSSVQRVYDLYGPSETTTYSTFTLRTRGGIPTIGRPIANTQVYLLNNHLQPAPIGVTAELHIGGAGLARGYLHRDELTAEKFIPDPFSRCPDSRLYKTGDLARYLPDGNIEYLGRMDHQVKIRGFRIELGEIESVLAAHPEVQKAVVVVREDLPGDKRLVAYLIAKGRSSPDDSELRNLVKTRLPDHMVPSVFVFLEKLPLSPNGKVDRKALPAPDKSRLQLGAAYVAPRTSTEEMLSRIWEDVLGLQQVGVQDNFFELGGHSLLATRVISRIFSAFRIEIALRTLFEKPTVAGLAVVVDKQYFEV